ncbi:guanylate kinase [Patescibacteria group bacterium]|nr:guanylate kinase [Patescibacteria group bacterium]
MADESSLAKEFLGKLFLIVGPSGSGKGTVISELKRRFPGFVYPISYTTREIREGESDGEVYHFVERGEFEKMIEAGEFLEYAVVHEDNYYGTSKEDILVPLRKGAVVVREVDIQGFYSIKDLVPAENLVSIFMKVSDREDLKGRILRRGEISDDELERRLDSARKEIAQAGSCDYQVENKWGEIKKCVNAVEKIIVEEIKDLY